MIDFTLPDWITAKFIQSIKRKLPRYNPGRLYQGETNLTRTR